MYAPRPTTKVSTFRACSALDRTTRSSCLRATTGRDSGSQFNLSNVLDVRAARKVRSRVASRLKPTRSRQREMHLARISAPPTRSISPKDKPARIDAHRKSGELCEVRTREIADLAVAFYASIMQQECNETAGALINKYTWKVSKYMHARYIFLWIDIVSTT